MSPQRMDSNFEGLHPLPITMRHQRGPRGMDYHPRPEDSVDVKEVRAILGNEDRLSPSCGTGWFYDDVLMGWRWADVLLSDEEREQVWRAREACALEEVGRG